MRIDDLDDADDVRIDLTAMVDVVFLLLIFFLVSTTFLDPERELDVELPTAESGSDVTLSAEEIVLTVTEDGGVWHGGERLERTALDALLHRAAAEDPDTPVTIRGHRYVRHEAIVGVMDACGRAGLHQLAVGTSSDEG